MTMPPEARSHDRFRGIYEDNYHRILGYALRRCRDPEDAADVVAETFLVGWRRFAELERASEARLWLYGVARRVLANQRRAKLRRQRLGDRLRGELRELSPALTGSAPDRGAEEVALALGELSERDREVIELAAWEGLEGRELAQVLGCSAGAARLRLHRARRRLAARLDLDGAGSHSDRDRGVDTSTGSVFGRPTKEDHA